jgi:hypothetical protein
MEQGKKWLTQAATQPAPDAAFVRHMVRGPDGRFGLALSGVNGVAIVEKN